MEGLHPLEGELENVQHLFDVGCRVMGLQHFFDNELGGSLHGLSDGGLTDFGRDVIREIERLNAIVDVTHSSEAVVRDVLDMTSRPIVLTHTGMRGACDSARNISDELMVRIAEGGGLIGIGYWKEAVCDTSPEKIVDNIRYAIDLLGLTSTGRSTWRSTPRSWRRESARGAVHRPERTNHHAVFITRRSRIPLPECSGHSAVTDFCASAGAIGARKLFDQAWARGRAHSRSL